MTGTVKSFDKASKRYAVALESGKKIKLKAENLAKKSKIEKDVKNVISALDPKLKSKLMAEIMAPNGLQKLLAHPLMKKLREDSSMAQFFQDLDSKGMFGALPYLSNKEVMSKLISTYGQMQ